MSTHLLCAIGIFLIVGREEFDRHVALGPLASQGESCGVLLIIFRHVDPGLAQEVISLPSILV